MVKADRAKPLLIAQTSLIQMASRAMMQWLAAFQIACLNVCAAAVHIGDGGLDPAAFGNTERQTVDIELMHAREWHVFNAVKEAVRTDYIKDLVEENETVKSQYVDQPEPSKEKQELLTVKSKYLRQTVLKIDCAEYQYLHVLYDRDTCKKVIKSDYMDQPFMHKMHTVFLDDHNILELTAGGKDSALYDLLGEQILCIPHFQQVEWHRGDITAQQVTKKLKRKIRKAKAPAVQFDPARHRGLNGHCTYSCLAYLVWKAQSLQAASRMRLVISKAWQEESQEELLQCMADSEQCDAVGYIQGFVEQGWGGLPEVHQFCRIYSASVCVWRKDGSLIARLGASEDPLLGHLQFHDKHYCVLKGKDIDEASIYSAGDVWNLRGGGRHDSRSPKSTRTPIRLITREERLEAERQRMDTRPPLARRKRQSQDASGEKKMRTTDEEDDKEKAVEPTRPAPSSPKDPSDSPTLTLKKKAPRKVTDDDSKHKDKKDKKAKKQKELKEHSREATHTQDSDKNIQKEKKIKVEYMAADRFQDIHGVTKEQAFGGASSSAGPSGAQSHAATSSSSKGKYAEASGKNISLDDPFFICVVQSDEGRICALCGKWIDAAHLQSARHQKQLKRFLDYSEENCKIYAHSRTTWVKENMLKPERGGGSDVDNGGDSDDSEVEALT